MGIIHGKAATTNTIILRDNTNTPRQTETDNSNKSWRIFTRKTTATTSANCNKNAEAPARRGDLVARNRRHSHVFAADVGTTTYLETLMHILKGNIGAGVFAMGSAMKMGGLILAPILTVLLGLICVHSQHILLQCAQKLKDRLGHTENPDFAETVEMCFAGGPPRMRGWAKAMKCVVNVFLCVTQMGFCCVYFVFISDTLKKVFDGFGIHIDAHWHMLFILLPILLSCLITSLKVLAICSTVANVCMITGIGCVFYYALRPTIPHPGDRVFVGKLEELPLYFGVAIFAFEGIALVLPLKNEMRRPQQFDRPLGVLNVGMVLVTVLFTAFGFVGYLRWGEQTADTVTLNLPKDDVLAVVVQLTVSLGMALTFPLQFFVPMQIMLPCLLQRFENTKLKPLLVELLFRTVFVIVIFLLAESVPNLRLFISLIGSFCSTALALAFPPIIQIIYEGTDNWWLLAKNACILLVALLGFLTGTFESMRSLHEVT